MGVVVGIDPNTSGFHAVELGAEGNLCLDQIRAEENSLVARLHHIHVGAAALVREMYQRWGYYTPFTFFVEEPLVAGARNLRTSLLMAQAVGALMVGLTTTKGGCYQVPVSRWKKETVGNGSASKKDVALWLSDTHPEYAAACDGSQDYADACCIALYGVAVLVNADAMVGAIGSAGQL